MGYYVYRAESPQVRNRISGVHNSGPQKKTEFLGNITESLQYTAEPTKCIIASLGYKLESRLVPVHGARARSSPQRRTLPWVAQPLQGAQRGGQRGCRVPRQQRDEHTRRL